MSEKSELTTACDATAEQGEVMRRLPIVFLITGLNTGGAEIQLSRIIRGLDPDRFTCSVVSLLPPGPVADILSADGIPVRSLGARWGGISPLSSIAAACRLVRFLRQERPSVLVSFMFHANMLGRLVGRLVRVPTIVSSIRNMNIGGRGRELAMRWTDCLDHAVVTNSALAARTLEQHKVVAPGQLRIIPNGVDVELFAPIPNQREHMRTELGLPGPVFAWITVGRLDPQKDHATLLRALKLVAEKRSETRLIIVGQGPLDETLRQEASTLGVADHVMFLGLRRDIADLLAAADAFVLASRWEGLPNALMEAMAASKVSVATDVGGIPELITEGQSGFMVPPQEPESLARAMLRVMELSPETKRKIGQAGQSRIARSFGMEAIVKKWESLFDGLVGHG